MKINVSVRFLISFLSFLCPLLCFPTKQVFSDVDNYIDDVTDADLYRCVELNCELPGASQLQVMWCDVMRLPLTLVSFVALRPFFFSYLVHVLL